MQLIKNIVYEYETHISNRKILDVDGLVQEYRYSDDEFEYFFQTDENEDVVVFACLAGYPLEEDDVTTGVGRVFQVETAILVKKDSDYRGNVYLLGDNNGYATLSSLNYLEVWSKQELLTILGEGKILDASAGFPHGEYSWH